MKKVIIPSMAAAVLASPAAALTIGTSTDAFVVLPPEVVNSGEITSDRETINESTSLGNLDSSTGTANTSTASFSNANGSGTASATASVDAETGTLRVGASAGGDGSSADASSTLVLDALVSGTGTLTAFFAIDVDVDVTASAPASVAWAFEANLEINPDSNSTGVIDAVFDTPVSGDVQEFSFSRDDEVLSTSIDLTNAVDELVQIQFFMLAGIDSTGFVNALSSGTAFLEASDGLTFRFEDESILGNPAFPSDVGEVPLGPTLPLLLVGLGAFAIIGRGRA